MAYPIPSPWIVPALFQNRLVEQRDSLGAQKEELNDRVLGSYRSTEMAGASERSTVNFHKDKQSFKSFKILKPSDIHLLMPHDPKGAGSPRGGAQGPSFDVARLQGIE